MPHSTTETLRARLAQRPPLVHDDQVANHLRILSAFSQFLDQAVPVFIQQHPESSQENARNAIFHRATYRLQLWVNNVIKRGDDNSKPLSDQEYPPLDVAMALHSYMLSPHRYYEDSQLRFPQLQRINGYPLSKFVDLLDPNGQAFAPTNTHKPADYWTEKTGLRYDPIASLQSDPSRLVDCSACGIEVSVPWNEDGRGFADDHFETICTNCGTKINHDSLQVSKFLSVLSHPKSVVFPNTADLSGGELDCTPCEPLVNTVVNCLKTPSAELPNTEEIMKLAATSRLSGGIEYLSTILQRSGLKPESTAKLLHSFSHSYPFTQDMVVALYNSYDFIEAMRSQGWTVTDGIDLKAGYLGYVDYLEQLSDGGHHDGPPLLVDLFWHTHQLSHAYRTDCMEHLRTFPNHVPFGEISMIPELSGSPSNPYHGIYAQFKELEGSLLRRLADAHRRFAFGVPDDIAQAHNATADANEQIADNFGPIIAAFGKMSDVYGRLNRPADPNLPLSNAMRDLANSYAVVSACYRDLQEGVPGNPYVEIVVQCRAMKNTLHPGLAEQYQIFAGENSGDIAAAHNIIAAAHKVIAANLDPIISAYDAMRRHHIRTDCTERLAVVAIRLSVAAEQNLGGAQMAISTAFDAMRRLVIATKGPRCQS